MSFRTFNVQGTDLPATKHYEGGYYEGGYYGKGQERQVAFYVDGLYMTRGPWSEIEGAIHSRRPMSVGNFIREGHNVEFVLDQPSSKYTEDDCKDLCWSGPKITVDQLREWIRLAA